MTIQAMSASSSAPPAIPAVERKTRSLSVEGAGCWGLVMVPILPHGRARPGTGGHRMPGRAPAPDGHRTPFHVPAAARRRTPHTAPPVQVATRVDMLIW
ncbi:hypothetical protein GCM10010381_64280 [Streptomyces xantholiticus]|nr:hypothetical protein GCM10010381_64280 [Streptomyces xantholiticus]